MLTGHPLRVPLLLAAASAVLSFAADIGTWLLPIPTVYVWWVGWGVPACLLGAGAALARRRDTPAFLAALAFLLLAVEYGLAAAGVYPAGPWDPVYLYALLAAVAAFVLHGLVSLGPVRLAAWILAAVAAYLVAALFMPFELAFSLRHFNRVLTDVAWVGLPTLLAAEAWHAGKAHPGASAQSL